MIAKLGRLFSVVSLVLLWASVIRGDIPSSLIGIIVVITITNVLWLVGQAYADVRRHHDRRARKAGSPEQREAHLEDAEKHRGVNGYSLRSPWLVLLPWFGICGLCRNELGSCLK